MREMEPTMPETDQRGSLSLDIVTDHLGIGDGNIHSEISEEDLSKLNETLIHTEGMILPTGNDTFCIDGRSTLNMRDGSEPRHGAKLAGGGLTPAIGILLAGSEFPFKTTSNDSKDKIREIFKFYRDNGEILGAHEGCGAAKETSAILRAYVKNKDANVDLYSTLYPQYAATVDFDAIAENASRLADELDQIGWDNGTLLDIVSSVNGEGSIEILKVEHDATHGHHEDEAVVNDAVGLSVVKNKLTEVTGRQIFVVDSWKAHDLARQASRTVKGIANVHAAQFAFNEGTPEVLTDGTLAVVHLKAA